MQEEIQKALGVGCGPDLESERALETAPLLKRGGP